MKKIIGVMLILSLIANSFVYADKKSELNQVNNDLKNIRNQMEVKKNKISDINSKILKLDDRISQIENKLANTKKQLDKTQEEINVNNLKITQKQKEISTLIKALKNRVRVMSKMKNINYLQIIFSSKSIKELFSNYTIIRKIVKQDKDNVQRLEKAKKELDMISHELNSQKTSLVTLKNDYSIQNKSLQIAKQEQIKNMDAVKNDLKSLEEIEDAKISEANEIAAEIRAMTASQNAYQGSYGGGRLMYPIPGGEVVSNFGYRMHPILNVSKFHTGIDIAAGMGQPIYAADDGRIIWSGPKSTYGNVVMIDHGSGIVTLYAHCSSLNCNIGDVVKKGQTVAYVGSTGRSTGPHLHFEVRVNGEYTDPMAYL